VGWKEVCNHLVKAVMECERALVADTKRRQERGAKATLQLKKTVWDAGRGGEKEKGGGPTIGGS